MLELALHKYLAIMLNGSQKQYLMIKIPHNSSVRMNKLELKQIKMQTLR